MGVVYSLDEIPRSSTCSIIIKDRDIINHRYKACSHRSNSVQDCLHSLIAHTSHALSCRRTASQSLRYVEPMRDSCWVAGSQNSRSTRFRDEGVDDWILGPGVRIYIHGCSAGGLPKESYSVRISTKGGYVCVDPFDCLSLV